jgi:hypothetical protein
MNSIIFSVNNNAEIKVLPVVPSDIEIKQGQNNEEFSTLNNGVLNLIGDLGLITLSISSILLNQDYAFAKKNSSSDAWSYVDFFTKQRKARIPLRLVMLTDDQKEVLNIACTIDNFSHAEMKNGDIRYSLEIKEYRFVSLVA